MADQLDDFINENRAEFDSEIPSPKIWNEIRDGLEENNSQQINTPWYWKAAAIILLLLSSYLIFDKVNQQAPAREYIALEEDVQDEFLLAEDYYFSLINEKIVEIQDSEMDPEIQEDFKAEIERLDVMYLELQSEYEEVQDEKVKDAMILNLQLRIDLLNEQLNVIKDIKSKENENTSIES
jgi:hypothetical protein